MAWISRHARPRTRDQHHRLRTGTAWLGAAGGNAVIGMDQLHALIAGGESLTVEFKSDRRQMSDKSIYEEIVSLANTAGGTLLIGVEDDGEIAGARPRHGTTTDPLRLQAAIFGNTVPSINTRVSVVKLESGEVLAIEVDRYPEPCATASGKSLHRIIGGDGKPQRTFLSPRSAIDADRPRTPRLFRSAS